MRIEGAARERGERLSMGAPRGSCTAPRLGATGPSRATRGPPGRWSRSPGPSRTLNGSGAAASPASAIRAVWSCQHCSAPQRRPGALERPPTKSTPSAPTASTIDTEPPARLNTLLTNPHIPEHCATWKAHLQETDPLAEAVGCPEAFGWRCFSPWRSSGLRPPRSTRST